MDKTTGAGAGRLARNASRLALAVCRPGSILVVLALHAYDSCTSPIEARAFMTQEATTVATGTWNTELADFIRRNVESMAFPPSERESAAYAAVSMLPRVVVSRPPPEDLLAAGFVHYDCHRNCGDQAANDPSGKSRHVSGWLPYGEDLILHSVAVIGNQWICLTPQLVPAPNRFEFIPDPHLEWRDTDGGATRTAFRYGNAVPEALRRDPIRHIRMRDKFQALVASGHSVIDARNLIATSVLGISSLGSE